jgi:hypothetical protein
MRPGVQQTLYTHLVTPLRAGIQSQIVFLSQKFSGLCPRRKPLPNQFARTIGNRFHPNTCVGIPYHHSLAGELRFFSA